MKRKEGSFNKRSMVTDDLSGLGADYWSDEWAFKRIGKNSPADADVVFNWPKLCKDFYLADAKSPYPEIVKQMAANWLTGCGGEFSRVSAFTVQTKVRSLRADLLHFQSSGYLDLEGLTPLVVQRAFSEMFLDGLAPSERVCARTLNSHLVIFKEIYKFSPYVTGGLNVDPFPGNSHSDLLRGLREGAQWEAPPEPVCLFLLSQSLRLLYQPADEVIRLRNMFAAAVEQKIGAGPCTKAAKRAAGLKAIEGEKFGVIDGEDVPWTDMDASNSMDVAKLIRHVQEACFIVISYTVGARVSEIRRLASSSVSGKRHENGEIYYYMDVARSKRIKKVIDSAKKQDMPWILSEGAVRAFEVLVEISKPLREKAKIDSVWLCFRSSGLWPLVKHKNKFSVLSQGNIGERLNNFAEFVGLEERMGWSRRLHSHQGRKALARFAAMRDRSSLDALALQFCHVSAESVDLGYATPDSDFRRLVQEELAREISVVVDEFASADVKNIFSNQGEEIVEQSHALILRFQGVTKKTGEAMRMLANGASLFPCEFGLCSYIREASLCGGSAHGPDLANRSPITCEKCKNFFALPMHRPWWERRLEDLRRFLTIKGLPQQSKILFGQQLEEAEKILEVLSGGSDVKV